MPQFQPLATFPDREGSSTDHKERLDDRVGERHETPRFSTASAKLYAMKG